MLDSIRSILYVVLRCLPNLPASNRLTLLLSYEGHLFVSIAERGLTSRESSKPSHSKYCTYITSVRTRKHKNCPTSFGLIDTSKTACACVPVCFGRASYHHSFLSGFFALLIFPVFPRPRLLGVMKKRKSHTLISANEDASTT